MKRRKDQKQLTITGIVTPTDWDEEGNIIAVAVSTPVEQEYLIAGNAIGRELLGLSGVQVVVTGIVGEDKEGNRTMTVKKYEVLEEEEEEEEEQGDEEEYEFEDEEGYEEELEEEEPLEEEELEEEQ